MRSFVGLLGWLVVSFSAAMVGSRFRPGAWFDSLSKPPWNPPSAVFAPVWTVLYATMGVAAWLVWRKAGFRGAALPLGLFVAQLLLNALWSYLFFGLHRPDLALLDIAALWVAILVVLVLFWRVAPPAGALLVPYLLWVTFASCLNVALWRLNR